MDVLTQAFNERLQEIDAYLDFLEALEQDVQTGPPKIGNVAITALQQRILYSSVYLQLYNLVEATATWCIDAVASAAANNGRWQPGDLSAELRREWVRFSARTHTELTYEHRLQSAVAFCDKLIDALPVEPWGVERGVGNWDDLEIEAITKRIGFELKVSEPAFRGVKRKIRDDKRPLELVKYLRNRLAHGSLSFAECGDGATVKDLRELRERTSLYLREVVAAFRGYIDRYEFLRPERRPVAGAAS